MKSLALPALRCLCLAALLIGSASAQERHLHSYTLQHALPEQIVPVLSAQLAPGSSVTPYHQQLIFNVTDAEYRRLQTLLEQLDTAPRSLLISVRKQSQQLNDEEYYGVQGRIDAGDVQIQTDSSRQRHSETRVTIDRGSAQSNREGAQQVRAVEGMEAFISTGSVASLRSGYYGEREFVPVQSGFYATARIVGDEIIIDIDQRDDRLQGRGIATQSLQTQVRGRIGEWIPLGGLNSAQAGSARGIASYGSNTTSAMSDLAIKVELIDR